VKHCKGCISAHQLFVIHYSTAERSCKQYLSSCSTEHVQPTAQYVLNSTVQYSATQYSTLYIVHCNVEYTAVQLILSWCRITSPHWCRHVVACSFIQSTEFNDLGSMNEAQGLESSSALVASVSVLGLEPSWYRRHYARLEMPDAQLRAPHLAAATT
jgi:hypothetical protein